MLLRALLWIEKAAVRRRLARLLEQPGLLISAAARREDLWRTISREDHDLVLVSGRGAGGALADEIATLRRLPDPPEVVVISEREDPEERGALLAAGCLAVVYEGLPDPVLRETLTTLVARLRDTALGRLRSAAAESPCRLSDFVSASVAMQGFLAVVRRVVASDSAVLLQGETGVGKERLARAIHEESARARGPFIAVNCAAVPETLLESELFGHEEGAFTGAVRSRRGYFELAHGGTLFLDEVGEMPVHLQVKLLRALQEHQIQRIGSEQAVHVDVRVMAATNRDLLEEVKAKRFRPDLYYRLGVVTLTIPPLRERRDDIPALLDSYLEYFRARLKRQITGISEAARETLLRYSWPGNVRELINVLERAVLLCAGSEISLSDLPDTITKPPASEAAARREDSGESLALPAVCGRPLREARRAVVDAFERSYLEDLLRSTGGRMGLAARRAGIGPRSLFDLLRKHGIRKETFREAAVPEDGARNETVILRAEDRTPASERDRPAASSGE